MDASVGDAGEVVHLAVERGEVVEVELTEMGVPARSGEHLHELDGALEEAGEAAGGIVDDEPLAQAGLLSGDG